MLSARLQTSCSTSQASTVRLLSHNSSCRRRPAAPAHCVSVRGETTDNVAIKQELREAIQGLDRGIFGIPAAQRQSIDVLIRQLEANNPLPSPTEHLDQVAGRWTLLYTTITITGVRKTKLGLREFVKLGDFVQIIDTATQNASNVVSFSVAGLGTIKGSLTVQASYQPISPSRVAITFLESTLVPKQLEQLFQQNYNLLLSIFNPDGWLDITYVDEELRVGRDDKGNVFLLERRV